MGRKMRPAGRGPAFVWIGVLMGVAAILAGCGKKAPPVPPQAEKPAQVEDLEADRVGDRVVLTWRLAKAAGNAAMPESFIIYRSTAPVSAEPCGPCPEVFEPIAAVDMPVSAERENRFTFSDAAEPGNRYIYQVSAYAGRTGVGVRSNPVVVIVE